mmetsp:Transcript_17778/g.36568  ORF Transcript_17778/g.36568 Transcript_17778/m.36568 type:complete len:81 (-) Transcript_17778:886-1128(-)
MRDQLSETEKESVAGSQQSQFRKEKILKEKTMNGHCMKTQIIPANLLIMAIEVPAQIYRGNHIGAISSKRRKWRNQGSTS